MSQKSEYSDSESRKDDEYEKRSNRKRHESESESIKTSKQTSERSESRKHDVVEYEKPSKRKRHESESESASESVSESEDRQDGTKEQESMKSTPQEKAAAAAADEASQTPKAQAQAQAQVEVSGSKPSRQRRFVRMFSYEDDKKILKALFKSGYTIGSMPFWEHIGHTLELTIEVDQKQLYGRIRRLKEVYLKGLKVKPSKRELKLYQLSTEIWKEAPKGKAARKSKKARKVAAHVQEEDNNNNNNNYDVKLDAFVRGLHNDVKFPVAESLEVVPASIRSILQKKWNDLNGHMFNVYKTKIDLIQETMEAVVSSPSFPSL